MNTPVEEPLDTIWSHIADLRRTLIRCLITLAIGFAFTLVFYQEVFSLLTKPLQYAESTTGSPLQKQAISLERVRNNSPAPVKFALPADARVVESSGIVTESPAGTFIIAPGAAIYLESIKQQDKLVIFGPVEGMVTSFKVCFWVSLVITAPFWLYFLLQFVAPALRSHEKRLLGPFLAASSAFCTAGLLFAYLVTLPLSNAFLWALNAEVGNNLWSLSNYLDYTLFLLLANAFAFELSLLLFFLVHLGIIGAEWMVSHRRHSVVAALIIAAILTPPDIPSQLMLAIPLMGLYEIAIFYARLIAKKQVKAAGSAA